MKKSMKILSTVLALTIMSANHVSALNVEVDIKTSTKHQDCKVYAEGIVSFVTLYSKSTDPSDKALFLAQVIDFKKWLKRCEKRNNKLKHDVGVKIGGTYNFTEK